MTCKNYPLIPPPNIPN